MSIKQTVKRGFTIVELLIVIVVIGILATIVIVTYQGVQNKANTTTNQTLAKGILGKIEAYNSVNTGFPNSIAELKASDDSTVKLTAAESDALDGTAPSKDAPKKIGFATCTDSDSNLVGVKLSYWDFDKKEVTEMKTSDCN